VTRSPARSTIAGSGSCPWWAGDRHLHPDGRAEQDERVADVVAVTHEGKPESVERAESFRERHQVGERLARMVARRQGVDHGDARVARQFLDRLVGARPSDDRVDVPREDQRRVTRRLTARELQLLASKDDRHPAELGDADLERRTRPGGRPGEKNRDAPPEERLGAVAWSALQLARALDQGDQLLARKLRPGDEMARLAHIGILVGD